MTEPILGTLAFSAGAILGSFYGVLISRAPDFKGALRGRSACDHCGRTLSASDLVPLFSWIFSRGRCHQCHGRISWLWPAIELATGSLFVIALLVAPDWWGALLIGPFLGVLLALSIIDLRSLRLPDQIVLPSVATAAAYVGLADLAGGALHLATGLAGAAISGGVLWLVYETSRRIYGREAMGFGDVKLAAFVGLVVGAIHLSAVAVALAVAILLGGLVGLVALAMGAGRTTAVPFGPMLCVGAFAAVVVGRQLMDAYLGLYR